MRDDCFVIGNGVVGQATRKALDIPYYFDLKESNIDLAEGVKKKWCFICLPTPTDEKNGQEKAIEVMRDYIKQIRGLGTGTIFVVRSTVLPGTCRALSSMTGASVASVPEFLSEATWEYDALNPRIKVIGADEDPTRRGLADLFRGIRGKIEIETDTVTAEMTKYAFNTFAVTKIVFANQVYDACQVVGADYEIVRNALHKHPWGSKHHFRVMDKGGRGAGGKCLPKDLKAFAHWANSKFLKTVWEINNEYLQKSSKT